MKFYLCVALILAIVAIGIEMKGMNQGSSMRSSPRGFITIEMDHDSESSSGWGSNGWGNGWGDGWGGKQMPRMQISIRKKMSLPNLGMMLSHGWEDSSEESGDGWSGGSSGGNSYGSGGGSYGGGGGSSGGWSSNGYDGNSGYSSYRSKRSRS